jgi:hypothetical protein
MYNVTLRRVHDTIVAVGKGLHMSVCVCVGGARAQAAVCLRECIINAVYNAHAHCLRPL